MPTYNHHHDEDMDWEDEDDGDLPPPVYSSSTNNRRGSSFQPHNSMDRLDHLEQEFTSELNDVQAEFHDISVSTRHYDDSDSDVEEPPNTNIDAAPRFRSVRDDDSREHHQPPYQRQFTDASRESHRSQEEEEDSLFWAEEDAHLHDNSYNTTSSHEDPFHSGSGHRRNMDRNLMPKENFVDVSHRDQQEEDQNPSFFRRSSAQPQRNNPMPKPRYDDGFEDDDDDDPSFVDESDDDDDDDFDEEATDTITSRHDLDDPPPKWENAQANVPSPTYRTSSKGLLGGGGNPRKSSMGMGSRRSSLGGSRRASTNRRGSNEYYSQSQNNTRRHSIGRHSATQIMGGAKDAAPLKGGMNESSKRSHSLWKSSRRKSEASTTIEKDSSDEDPLLIVDKTPDLVSEKSLDSEDFEPGDVVFEDDDQGPPARRQNQRSSALDKQRSKRRSSRVSMTSFRDWNAWLIGMVALCCCCVLLAIAIVLPVYFLVLQDNGNDDNNQGTKSNNPTTPTSPEDYVLPLPQSTQNAIETNLLSPQARAYDWLVKDPNLEDYPEDRRIQRFALAAFYYGMRGENWTTANDNQNWLDYDADECAWGYKSGFHTECQDVSTEDADATTDNIETAATTKQHGNIFDNKRRHQQLLRTRKLQDQQLLSIVSLNLPNNNLVGLVPPQVALLSHLTKIDLGHNSLYSSLPVEAASFRNLKSINLTNNMLTGEVPWVASPLEVVDLSNNKFDTTIPNWLSNLKNLRVLDLSFNEFKGYIPQSTMSWGKTLERLHLQHNKLTGRLPNEVGYLSNLKIFEADHNQLVGILPWQLGAMAKVQELLLYNNELTGPIPSEVGRLEELVSLELVGNKLNGTLPTQMALMTKLETLWLYDNELSGEIPKELGKLADHALQHAIIYDNDFMGVIPDKLCLIEEIQHDCEPLFCGCNCTCELVPMDTVYDVNSTDATPDSSVTDEFSIGSAEGQEVINGTVAPVGSSDEPADLGNERFYGVNFPVKFALFANAVKIEYIISQYVKPDSMQAILYDGIKCRNGDNDVTESNQYLVFNWTLNTEDARPNPGTNQFDLYVIPDPEKIKDAPFYTEDGENKGTLDFCVGLSIGYNKDANFKKDVEVNAIETAFTMELDFTPDAPRLILNPIPGTVVVPTYPLALSPGINLCEGTEPELSNIPCFDEDGNVFAAEQSPVNVTKGYKGKRDATAEPLTTNFASEGLCPINVNWRLGAEHYSMGNYDENGLGPTSIVQSASRLGYQCFWYNESDPAYTTEYNWTHCQDMQVGQTYEIQWPHSKAGACGTDYQYQTPSLDGMFCNDAALNNVARDIGIQAQVFTVVNDEEYYYPDLISGMIQVGDWGTDLAKYTGSTTGTSRNNEDSCSQVTPITWHVDRACHRISASSFDKLCADMKAQADDMSEDLFPHGARPLVTDNLAANNHRD